MRKAIRQSLLMTHGRASCRSFYCYNHGHGGSSYKFIPNDPRHLDTQCTKHLSGGTVMERQYRTRLSRAQIGTMLAENVTVLNEAQRIGYMGELSMNDGHDREQN
jgi:hypothetical protein